MNSRQPSEARLVLDNYMPPEQNSIRHDDFVANDAVVSDM
jgi:hypothetical protein